MAQELQNLKVAVLIADGFEQVEFTEPKKALEAAGATVQIISPMQGKVEGWNHHDKADKFDVDVQLEQAKASDFDALLLPGGVANPDQLRMEKQAVQFVKDFFEQNKPVAAICHAPWTLIEADVVRGKKITSWESLHTDLTNAGAEWTNEEVVVDGNLVTSRKPDDIPAFNEKVIELFAKAAKNQSASA